MDARVGSCKESRVCGTVVRVLVLCIASWFEDSVTTTLQGDLQFMLNEIKQEYEQKQKDMVRLSTSHNAHVHTCTIA